jgi:hypothetical protein
MPMCCPPHQHHHHHHHHQQRPGFNPMFRRPAPWPTRRWWVKLRHSSQLRTYSTEADGYTFLIIYLIFSYFLSKSKKKCQNVMSLF